MVCQIEVICLVQGFSFYIQVLIMSRNFPYRLSDISSHNVNVYEPYRTTWLVNQSEKI